MYPSLSMLIIEQMSELIQKENQGRRGLGIGTVFGFFQGGVGVGEGITVAGFVQLFLHF